MNEIVTILGMSMTLAFVIAIMYKVMIDPDKAKMAKAEMQHYKDKIKEARKSGNLEEVNKLTMESMKSSQKQFSLTMKPLLLSLILFWVFFSVLGGWYGELTIASPFNVPLTSWEFPFVSLSPTLNWFWWYLVIIIPSSMLFRKLAGAYPY